jgi:hypothetical protein
MLFRECPSLGPALLARAIDFTVPEGAQVRVTSAEFADIDPAEYRADVVLRVDGEHGQAEDIFIIEVQLDINKKKHYSWPSYMTGARNRFQCLATLVVVALDERVARWSAAPIVLDRAGSEINPVVISAGAIPVITEPERARQEPELAVLSAVAHGSEQGSENIALAGLAACAALDNPRANLYADLILASLNEAARLTLDAIMAQHNYAYQSDFAKKYVAEGKRETLREQMELRFGELPAELLDRIDSADSDALSLWTRRILTAGSLAEVVAD